jgi:hypothetical protein
MELVVIIVIVIIIVIIVYIIIRHFILTCIWLSFEATFQAM